jgi:NADPH:quinone reductase
MIAVLVTSLRRKPHNLSFGEAASVGVNYVAAWCRLEVAGLKVGETVLLIGAGGSVGGAAAQIAKRIGAPRYWCRQAGDLWPGPSPLSGAANDRAR